MRRSLQGLATAAFGFGGVATCHPGSGGSSADGAASGCPMFKKAAATPAQTQSSGCPIMKSGSSMKNDAEEIIDPTNMMPNMSQQPAAGQQGNLSTARVESTIPKGDGGTWEYPSPQMFYNALRRKGKSAEGQEKHMKAVVAIHNNMNEITWKKVLEWEALHCDTCDEERKLIRFVGRPDELTGKAAFNYYLGLTPRPFDRHDWTVDRCGTQVRYVIDYYDVPENADRDELPALDDGEEKVPSIRVDVRPALDSATAAYDRLRVLSTTAASAVTAAITSSRPAEQLPAVSSAGSPESGTAATEGEGDADAAPRRLPRVSADERLSMPYVNAVRSVCSDRMEALRNCASERECGIAHIALTMCIAEQVCSAEAEAFKACGGKAAEEAEFRYGKVEQCITKWGAEAAAANRQ